MLTRLSIRNIVLIEALELDFGRGLGVLTGETGAGKSILLDALGLVLGDRADSGLVRAGADKRAACVRRGVSLRGTQSCSAPGPATTRVKPRTTDAATKIASALTTDIPMSP